MWAVLEGLFVQHGAPLVVKSDNGGPLIGGAVPGVLARWGVTALRSPPNTPSYNGACEAGVGSVKRGAEAWASRHGRPGYWTLDDLEAARCHANLFGRPRGSPDVAPQERWNARRPVTLVERAVFLAACRRARIREELRCGSKEFPASPADAATLERAAVSTVLAELRYLKFRRE